MKSKNCLAFKLAWPTHQLILRLCKTGNIFKMCSLIRHQAGSLVFHPKLLHEPGFCSQCSSLLRLLATFVMSQQGDLHLCAAVDLNGRKSVIVFSEALMMSAAGSREFTVCAYTLGALWSGRISIKRYVLSLLGVSLKRLLLKQLQGRELKLLTVFKEEELSV